MKHLLIGLLLPSFLCVILGGLQGFSPKNGFENISATFGREFCVVKICFLAKCQCPKTSRFRDDFDEMPKIMVGKKGRKTPPLFAAAKVSKIIHNVKCFFFLSDIVYRDFTTIWLSNR